ncbi:hypothetical protein BT69DRAFT_1236292 [Atractiella rhizophila]|nr:hypothetical protein BT69DRAFT_1236292 [Atractiella rhizophila]
MPVPAPEMSSSALLAALYQAPDEKSCQDAASSLAGYVFEDSASFKKLWEEGILKDLIRGSKSKSGYERESAMIAFHAIFQKAASLPSTSSGGYEPYFLSLIPTILSRYEDASKAGGEVVRDAAAKAISVLINLVPVEQLVPRVLMPLFDYLDDSSTKWRSKVGALELVAKIEKLAQDDVADNLEAIIPRLTTHLQDTKAEVSSQAFKTAQSIFSVLRNPDIQKFIPTLIQCFKKPDTVPAAIKDLSSYVFVHEIDSPTMSVLHPLLERSLKEMRNQTLNRQSVILIGNLFKLIRDRSLARRQFVSLIGGVQRIEKDASFPEVREFAREARVAMEASADLKAGDKVEEKGWTRESDENKTSAYLAENISKRFGELRGTSPDVATFHAYVSSFVVGLADRREFDEATWMQKLERYFWRVVGDGKPEEIKDIITGLNKCWKSLDKERNPELADDEDDDGAEILMNLPFSLAYGGLLLLNHTVLKLKRGHRYGIVAANGSGKSSLLNAINQRKLENFPEEVSTFFVSHDIDGIENTTSPTIEDFILKDPRLRHQSKEKCFKVLEDVGFDDEKKAKKIEDLSGGWKMKLALARAMLCGADLLLLDEPTNHLDKESVAFLERWLTAQNATNLIVSHDSAFLDTVCTDIIHYESKKLVYYKGNLSKFVERHPEAKSYYSLSHSNLKFSFPVPGSLMGVRSRTRAILKMTDVTFTYPGASKPSLFNVSCAVSLSSRIGITGRNGAGKSTLIKLLTGDSQPDSGKVEKHPSVRIAYMSQYAFHHIEQHLEKSAVDYIMWRYANGVDKEQAEKVTRKLDDEDLRIMATPIKATTGEERFLESIMGRQKLKKSFTYEIKFKNLDHRYNAWIPRERLLELGFQKLVSQFDDFEASREGSGSREISTKAVRALLEEIGLNGDIAEYNEMKGLSGGQKVKVCLAAAMWSKPQILIMDEPTNFLDRDSLGGLAVAIREWAGAVVLISHNQEFLSTLCPETWHVQDGRIISKGLASVTGDALSTEGGASTPHTPAGMSPSASGTATPISGVNTPNGIEHVGFTEGDVVTLKKKIGGKKKMTRKQLKDREERRRLRTVAWLSSSIPGTQRFVSSSI